MVLPLPQGNHVVKFGKDPIYRTKVIVQKPVWTPAITTLGNSSINLVNDTDSCEPLVLVSSSYLNKM
jgi:hypothetical protein